MVDGKQVGGAGRRRPVKGSPEKEPGWTALLIRLGITIVLFNILAGVVAWYFLSSRRH